MKGGSRVCRDSPGVPPRVTGVEVGRQRRPWTREVSAGFKNDPGTEAEQDAEASVPSYLKEADPHLRALLSAAGAALPRSLAGKDAATAVDNVRDTALDLQHCVTASTYPDSVLANRLQVFAGSCASSSRRRGWSKTRTASCPSWGSSDPSTLTSRSC
jgi:hypothetical protein